MATTVLIASLLPSLSFAEGPGMIQHAQITGIVVDSTTNNLLLLKVAGAESGRPQCAKNNGFQFAVQLGASTADAMLRIVLQARLSNAAVSLTGTGTCDTATGVELLKAIEY